MEVETNTYIQRMMSLKDQLKEQASEFELIEQEKDKKQRKLKQKEYVDCIYNSYTIFHIHTCVYIFIYIYIYIYILIIDHEAFMC